MHNLTGKKDTLLSSRASPIPESSLSGPIYVCTRNDDLEAIIEKTPVNRREDLVFLQNGILSPYLQSKGLLANTQGRVGNYAVVVKHISECFSMWSEIIERENSVIKKSLCICLYVRNS